MRQTSASRSGSEFGRGTGGAASVSRQLNAQITQAANLQDLIHVVVVNFGRMNAVNHCTAYHRIARHMQDERTPPDAWPPPRQQQLGSLLTQLNQALLDRLEHVQAQNLGLTLWSISKTHRLPQQHLDELCAALQAEVVRRLATVSQATYMTDKHYNFGAQSLSNIVYSAASMGLPPDYDVLHAVGRAVAWQAADFKPQGLANILWALGKLGVKLTHEVRAMVDALAREMAAQLTHARHKGSFSPQNVSNSLHGIVNIGFVPPPELLSALVQCADGMLRQFGPQELTNLVWSLSMLQRTGTQLPPDAHALLDRVPDELGLLLGDRGWRARMRPQTISNLALAYAHLGRRPQLLMASLVKEAVPLLPQFKPQELSNLLWSMATMDFWPGPAQVEAIAKAAGAAAQRMKPQEMANTCWALATLRFFPGAALLDAMLAHAEPQLDRFKSQELGMLAWAMARLAYMPAATLVAAMLPLAAEWRAPAVQDCGNLLWACTVLGILSPEAMELLGGKLLSLRRESFTQEAYIQLYQAKMSLSQQVYDIAQYIPPELLSRGEIEWRKQAEVLKVSVTHRDVASVVSALGIEHDIERRIEDGLMSVDIALRGELVAVEVDGSAHFTQNEPFVPLGRTLWRWRLLQSRGWRVVSVPYFQWGTLRTLDEKKKYLYRLLQCQSVWECYGLDPRDPDAPPALPANLAHLTPEEVYQYAAEGVSCSTLLQQRADPTPATSPSTPLLAGLGPAINGGLSSSFSPSTGLRPASSGSSVCMLPPVGGMLPGSGLALPLPLGGGLVQLPMGGATAAAAGTDTSSTNGYSQLPDSLYGGDSPRSTSAAQAFAASRPGSRGGGSSGLNVSARPFTLGGAGSSMAGSGPLGGSSPAPAAAASHNAGSSGLAQGLTPSAHPFSPAPPQAGSYRASPALTPGSLAATASGSQASSSVSSPAMPQFGGSALPSPSPLQPLRESTGAAAASLKLPKLAPASPTAVAPLLARTAQSQEAAAAAAAAAVLPASLPGLDDDSDDDVGDLRSFFGAVIGVAPESAQEPAGPLSVDEVQRKLALLPADVAVADVAPAWLSGWDAARLCELLRLLASPTTAARAVQLFDWLRALPQDSPLVPLRSPDAFAVMIHLYGGWRRPKPAVRLFAELKDRGEDTPEVHSALVHAFCRSGQYEVAVDAYRNMQALGLQPSPAALTALLDQHMAREAWEAVDAALAAWAEQGGAEEGGDATVFERVVQRAAAAGNAAAAQAAVERMLSAGATPSLASIVALLDVLRRQLSAAEVAEVAARLASRGGGASASRVAAAVQEACALRGWSDVATQLLLLAEDEGRVPGLDLINGVLAACAAAAAVEDARLAWARLARYGLQPSAASHQHWVAALCGAGHWVEGVQVYEEMLAGGLEPSEELAALAVDALWSSGLAWAQARALHLFEQAASAGWLPPSDESQVRALIKVDLRRPRMGPGVLRMRAWLAGKRAAIGNRGGDSVLDHGKRVCVMAHAGQSEHVPAEEGAAAAAALKDALGATLVLAGAPFRVAHEAGRAQRMESSAFMLRKWLFTEAYEQWERSLCAAAALASAEGAAALLEGRAAQEARLEEQAQRDFSLIQGYESTHPPVADALRLAPSYRACRRELAAAAHQLVLGLGLSAEVWHAAAALLDRAGAAGHTSSLDALFAAAAVALAAGAEGGEPPLARLAVQLDGGAVEAAVGCQPEAALSLEVQGVTEALHGDTACISAVHCWRVYAARLACDVDDAQQVEALLGCSFQLLQELALGEAFSAYPPSVLAAAALYLGRKQRGVVPFWPAVLQRLTGYDAEKHPELSAALQELQQTSQYGSTVSQAVFA